MTEYQRRWAEAVTYLHVRALLTELLEESPLTGESVIEDFRTFLRVGEEELGFDLLCSWLYEDSLPITQAYLDRLTVAAHALNLPNAVRRLDELVAEFNAFEQES